MKLCFKPLNPITDFLAQSLTPVTSIGLLLNAWASLTKSSEEHGPAESYSMASISLPAAGDMISLPNITTFSPVVNLTLKRGIVPLKAFNLSNLVIMSL